MNKKFLSLEWFKAKAEKSIDRVIENKLNSIAENEEPITEKPYVNIKLVNDTLTIVLLDYSILTKPNATEEDFSKALNATSLQELYKITSDNNVYEEKEKIEKKEKKIEALKEGIELLASLNDFNVENNVVTLKGNSRSLPQLLVEKFIEVVHEQKYLTGFENLEKDLLDNEEYQSLIRFFMWCCLNPRAEVANELYRFLTDNSFRITKQGFFVALRNVVTLHGSPELVHFISNTYNKVKAVWKKSPNDYTVFLENNEYKLVSNDKLFEEVKYTSTMCESCNGEGEYYCYDVEDDVHCEECDGTGEVEEYEYTIEEPVFHGEKIGNLTDLYLDLPNRAENRFTDDWTKTFDIRVGKVTNMPKEECNWSTQDCAAAGLHFTADQIHYVGCGDQSVLVLINPMKVVGIGTAKGRCYEYLPIMTVPRNEATTILHDGKFDTLQLDEDYAIRELESLEEKVKEGLTVESKKHEFNLPNISMTEIRKLVLSLDKMKETINKRVVSVD